MRGGFWLVDEEFRRLLSVKEKPQRSPFEEGLLAGPFLKETILSEAIFNL
jgi:hypothetical protein